MCPVPRRASEKRQALIRVKGDGCVDAWAWKATPSTFPLPSSLFHLALKQDENEVVVLLVIKRKNLSMISSFFLLPLPPFILNGDWE